MLIMMDLHIILYMSTMREDYSDERMEILLEEFTRDNKKNNITGFMLYYERNIIQCIEGRKEDIYRLYDNIENDPRHFLIIKLMDERISKRNFIDWDLAFKKITYEQFESFSLNKLTSNKKVRVFFKQFLTSFSNN